MRGVWSLVLLAIVYSGCLATDPGIVDSDEAAASPGHTLSLSGSSLRTPAIAFIIDNTSSIDIEFRAAGTFTTDECTTHMLSFWDWEINAEWTAYWGLQLCPVRLVADVHAASTDHRVDVGLHTIEELVTGDSEGTFELGITTREPVPLNGPTLVLWQHNGWSDVRWKMNITGVTGVPQILWHDGEPDCWSTFGTRTGSGVGVDGPFAEVRAGRSMEFDLQNRSILHLPLAGYGHRAASLTLSDDSVIDLSGGGASPAYSGWLPPWMVVERPGPATFDIDYDAGTRGIDTIDVCNIPTIAGLSTVS